MNKRILLTLIFVLIAAVSVGTIYASDVNVTDSYTSNSQDDGLITVGDDSSELKASETVVDNDPSNDVLKSEDSSTLSTNTEKSNVISDTASSADISKSVASKDITKYYKGSQKYTATFYDANGAALANSDVIITVNGQNYNKKTDGNGIASLDINLKPGTYDVVAKNPVTGYNQTNKFTILSTISAKDISKVYTDGKKFYATFLKSNGKALAKKTVKFKINGKTYKVKTNNKGVASLSLKTLKKGTHKIISYNTDGLTKTNKVKVVKSVKTSLTAKAYTFLKKDSKKIKVQLLNAFGYAPSKGKIVKFKVNGKTYSAKTNAKGIATLKLPSLKEGVYTVKYSFSKSGFYKASSTKGKLTIIPNKNPTFTVKSTTTFGHGAGTEFKVALTSGKVPIADKTVTLSVNGETFTKTTNSKGIVSLPINLDIGKYKITYTNKADSKINKKTESVDIQVIERGKTSVGWKTSTSFNQGTQSSQLLVSDSNNKPIANAQVKLTVNSKTYAAKTNANGYATVTANYDPGSYEVSYEFVGDNLNAPSSGKVTLNVIKIPTVSVKNIVSAAVSLKTFYATNKRLPNTVTAAGISFTVPEFLYMMSQAITQISNSNMKDIIYISDVSAPSSPTGDNIASKDLTKANYLTVAKNVASYISTNNQAPNYASSYVGKIIYSELVDASARILSFYSSNNRLPSYVTISYSSGSSSSDSHSGTGLNEKNTVADLSQYLKSTKNCQVNNAAIKKVVDSLIKGKTTATAKAKAIFNYVRDTISYSFYYDTKYGAAGTLTSKTGNCVDHSHLLVAMFRTAGLPARYVHGKCTFTSGSTYGHVWTQVLIDGKWTVADATSSRNSLGSIANWNTKSFTLNGIYSGISF